MARVYAGRMARLGLIGFLGAIGLLSALSAGSADVDDPSQVVMLANSLVTGTYGWPAQTRVQRMAVYHNYALVQLGVPLPPPAPSPTPAANAAPVAAPSPASNGASPSANGASPAAAAAAPPRSSPQGSGSFVAFKAHRNWVVLFSKSGSYSQKDLIAAGIPPDVVSGLFFFLKPPPSQPPSPT